MERMCDHLLSFIADELGERDKRKFEEHMQQCTKCSKEYENMTDVWHSLYLDIEEQEVPESLKADVMEFVFNNEKKSRKESFKITKWLGLFSRQFSPTAMVTVLLLMGLSISLAFANSKMQDELTAVYTKNEQPIEVLSTLSLQAVNPVNERINTGGAAFIIQQGERKSLVVQLKDLPKLQGSEVYQVWLLKNGKRKNAGIFKPDERGSGMLTYQFAQDTEFDQIGITVEPDEYSLEPRGEKIVGS
ncbi:anti-sigma factor [Bacillus sp. B190/17]|uniref:Regulator of SigK n=1 Tax=Bacillus lumedeiriae TaxID=3058829 RepID=A0ABW8I5P9_9BACI